MKRAPIRALNPEATMRDYAFAQVLDLIRRAAFRANRAQVLRNAQSVHDLRVSIRRLIECLRTFRQFFPREEARKIKRRLKKTIDLGSEVRNRDVALGLLRRSHLSPDAPLLKTIAGERRRAAQALRDELRLWSNKNIQKKWRRKLGL